MTNADGGLDLFADECTCPACLARRAATPKAEWTAEKDAELCEVDSL